MLGLMLGLWKQAQVQTNGHDRSFPRYRASPLNGSCCRTCDRFKELQLAVPFVMLAYGTDSPCVWPDGTPTGWYYALPEFVKSPTLFDATEALARGEMIIAVGGGGSGKSGIQGSG